MFYFNCAGLSAARKEAIEEELKIEKEFSKLLFSERGVKWYRSQLDINRRRVALLLNKKSSETIYFIPNASTAIYWILTSLNLQPGSAVITSNHEHPAVTNPLSFLSHRGIQILTVPCDSEGQFIDEVHRLCRSEKVRLILISHVSYKDGRILPVKRAAEAARIHNKIIAIDGAQAVGHIPVDLELLDVDYYVFSGHKWCFAPMGTGALAAAARSIVLSEPTWPNRLETDRRSTTFPFCSEIGTQNISAIAGFGRACQIRASEMDIISRFQKIRDSVKNCLSTSSDVEIMGWCGSHAPGILSFRLTNNFDHTNMANYLYNQHRIVVKPITFPEQPDSLRISWSDFTKDSDIWYLLGKLRSIIKNLSPKKAGEN